MQVCMCGALRMRADMARYACVHVCIHAHMAPYAIILAEAVCGSGRRSCQAWRPVPGTRQ
jgi:hypothetical protein